MHYNTGYQHDAAALMRHTLKVLRDAETICIPSSSCVAHIREHYPKVAASIGDAELIRAVAGLLPRIFEFSELLVDKLGIMDLAASFPHKVTLHPSCHSIRSLHLGAKPASLLRHVRGLQLLDLPEADQCCGFGGTFAIKNGAVSSAMLEDKMNCIRASGAEYCTAVDNSCLMHIGGGLSRQGTAVRCLHLAEILACAEGSS